MSDLEKQLREAAQKSGLSMLTISKRTGVPYSAIHSFLASKRGMTLATASKIATLLEIEFRSAERKKV